MAIEISSVDQVKMVMSQNKLRQYPGAKKGRIRLLPYARPKIVTQTRFKPDATFFVVGNCFARSIEKSLSKAGRQVLSSPTDLDLPGTATQQYQRYNVFNLDVATNEVSWAINPNSQPMEDALIRVDDEWVDMQIHWTFAHDEQTAKRYRKVYNGSYRGIAEADVVIVSTAGIEQWFDNECGLYLNIMPTPKMADLEPGRYDFHRLDVEASAERLRRFCELVIKHGKPGVRIMVAVSPVSQPAIHSGHDALVDQFFAKSVQRCAADIVCSEIEQLEYLPSLEAAMLSDFQFSFRDNSINHTSQALSDRVVAEMLDKYLGESDGQRLLFATGHADGMLKAGDVPAGIAYIEELIAAKINLTGELEELYVRGLANLERQADALTFLFSQMDENRAEDRERTYFRLMNLVKLHGSDAQIARAVSIAEGEGYETELLRDVEEKRAAGLMSGGANSLALKELATVVRDRKHDEAIETAEALLADEALLSPNEVQRVLAAYVQSLMQSGKHPTAIAVLLERIETSDEVPDKWKQQLINLARTHADLPMLDRIWMMTGTFSQVDLDKTLPRRERLVKQGGLACAN